MLYPHSIRNLIMAILLVSGVSLIAEDNTTMSTICKTFNCASLSTSYRSGGSFATPDMGGSMGPTQYMAFWKFGIRSFDKATMEPDDVFEGSPGGLWGVNIFDQKVLFDTYSKRWFFVALGEKSSITNPSRETTPICIAISEDSVITPSTKFRSYVIDSLAIPPALPIPQFDQRVFLDYDRIGIDKDALYFIANDLESGSISNLYVFQKESLLHGGPVVANAFRGLNLPPFVTTSAINYNRHSQYGYFFTIKNQVSDFNPDFPFAFVLIRVKDPGSLHPTLDEPVAVEIPTWEQPSNTPSSGVTHPGPCSYPGSTDYSDAIVGYIRLDPNDKTEHLFYAQNILFRPDGGAPRNGIRFYEFRNLDGIEGDGKPILVQYADIFDKTPINPNNPTYYSFVSIATNKHCDVTISCNASSGHFDFDVCDPSYRYFDAVTFRRNYDDPKYTFGPEQILAKSDTSYNVQGYYFQGWGDYSWISVDPDNDEDFWATQQYCSAIDDWSFIVAQLKKSDTPC